MNIQKRLSNEKTFDTWTEKEDGGRIYSFEIAGRYGWRAKYIKETNATETTIRFWQEIYDDQGVLREIHEKYPVDKGHQKINENDNQENNS